MKITKAKIKAIEAVIAYLWHDEKKDYDLYKFEKNKNAMRTHIFNNLKVLNKMCFDFHKERKNP